jgi:hypothetical protein
MSWDGKNPLELDINAKIKIASNEATFHELVYLFSYLLVYLFPCLPIYLSTIPIKRTL